ncbi:MD-2-related lipid-recognition protein-like [Adelges cooleyi]|uniref:MD-2-related lipid-recognition protein-like n=1 Tax=Adelges cooleyi TaxID=133065 RepID=UPI0021800438|nr:MD-2-related lipid-recognition protein-like [Adelges cooleyi]
MSPAAYHCFVESQYTTNDHRPTFKMVYSVLFVLAFVSYHNVVNAEEISFKMCPSKNPRCKITKVNIDPCPEALENRPCEVPLGITASITLNYIPDFNSTVPKTRLYSVKSILDIPFLGMDTNACLYTACPVRSGVPSRYTFQLHVSTLYPRNSYLVKLRLWDDDSRASEDDECCMTFDLALV